jgi:hypothetical protein
MTITVLHKITRALFVLLIPLHFRERICVSMSISFIKSSLIDSFGAVLQIGLFTMYLINLTIFIFNLYSHTLRF